MQVIATCMFLVAAIAGKFTLQRLDLRYQELGFLGEPRIWLIAALVVLTFPMMRSAGREAREPGERDYSGKYLVLVISLHVYFAVSYLWSPQNDSSRSDLVSALLVIALISSMFLIARVDTYRFTRVLFYLLLFTSLVYAVGGLLFPSYAGTGGLSFFWGGPNVYVRIVGSGAIIALYFWLKTRRGVWLAFVPLLLFTAVMSGSRGGVLSLLLVLLLSSLLLVRKTGKVVVFLALLILLVVVFLYTPLFGTYRQYVEERYPRSLTDFAEEYERARSPWFSASMRAFGQSPALGTGIGGLTLFGINYSHSIVINIASEGGLAGLLLFILTLLPLIGRWRQPRDLEANACFVLGVYFLFASLVSGSYYDWRFVWIFFLLFTMLSGRSQIEEKEALMVEG